MPHRLTAWFERAHRTQAHPDDQGGAHAATTHLIEHGHRRIGFIGDTLSIATTASRLDGYRAALADAATSLAVPAESGNSVWRTSARRFLQTQT